MSHAERIAAALRAIAPEGKLMAPEIPLIDQLAGLWKTREAAPPAAAAGGTAPPWIVNARGKIGERELPGSKHNPWITSTWQRLGAAWFNDDETPWCGNFVAWCLDASGLPYPKEFPRAASFKDYGFVCAAQLGAIGVKSRKGGNHVFFIVGQTADRMFYKALGGNQSDMVCIIDIRKTDVDAIRWPPGVPQPVTPILPILPAGKVSTKES